MNRHSLSSIRDYEGAKRDHYTLYGSLSDLFVFSILRLITAVYALFRSYCSDTVPLESPFDLYHPNGDRKTREELDNEALEETCCPWFRRYVTRPAFFCEVICLVTGLLSVTKCLARLNEEVGTLSDSSPSHLLFWLALALSATFSAIEPAYLDSIVTLAGECGRSRRQQLGRSTSMTWMRRMSSHMSIPLLSADTQQPNDQEEQGDSDVEQGESDKREDVRGVSDITGDSSYKAKWSDLLALCIPDAHLIAMAFVFLLLAAMAQIYIPRFTGKILDSLTATYAGKDDDAKRESIWDIPGFVSNVELLVVASILGGVFSGVRGSIFTVVGGRVNVRLRVKLMDALLAQDIGFFDVTRTGDITSRLSSDTTLVGDQVTLNVNVFLRSLVQAIGVLAFMFMVSWQLSMLAFISVPVITVLSKWYGEFIRRLTKLMQKKVCVCRQREALYSMTRTNKVIGRSSYAVGGWQFCE
jgi:hypothetical protein